MKIFSVSLALLCLLSLPAQAERRASSLRAAEAEARKISKAEKELAKRIKRLNAFDRRALKVKRIGTDSDRDGVSDIFEGAIGSNRCDNDSDDDGVEDGSDSREDEFGKDDGESEFEVKGLITSFSDSSIGIGEASYLITKETRFGGRGFSEEDIEPGVCVQVKGLSTQGENRVQKVELEDDCSDE